MIGVDDAHTASIHTRLASRGRSETVPVSVGKVLGRGVFAVDGALYDAWGSRAAKVMDLSAAAHLPGAHNWQNAALAYAATKPFVKDSRAIASAIADFPGLPHRIEDVGRLGKVRFINDSKATNADAAERALVCFNDIFWIAGGRPKAGGIESLVPHFSRIRKAYLIGEAANEFARTLGDRVTASKSGTLDHAVASAAADARRASVPAPIVLLSPACASFDQFRDFEERGDAFRALVADLARPSVRRRHEPVALGQKWLRRLVVDDRSGRAVRDAGAHHHRAHPRFRGESCRDRRAAHCGRLPLCRQAGRVRDHRGRDPPHAASVMSLRAIKISSAIVYALAVIGSALVLFTGSEVLGAKRWIDLGWMTLQPSEFLKPGFAVLAASVLADKAKMIVPKEVVTFLLILPALIILPLQPDVGQTGLLLALWGALLFFNGVVFRVDRRAGRRQRGPGRDCLSVLPNMCAIVSTSSSARVMRAIRRDWR